jgi:FkbM family methyltransferase
MGKIHEGVWLPEDETHLVGMMSPGAKRFCRLPDGRASYQRHKYLAALALVGGSDGARVFVDVGAHVGLWSMQAEYDFETILAFEPHPVHADLYEQNVTRSRGITLFRVALGETKDSVSLRTAPTSSGDTYIAGPGPIPMQALDDFDIPRIDLLKIDTEGFELPILLGAHKTLLRTKPVIVVEQKGRDALYRGSQKDEALVFLRELGAHPLRPAISGDHFYGWKAP